MDEKLVDKEYLLEKLPGKYGWTYTIIPEIRPDPMPRSIGWKYEEQLIVIKSKVTV